ncbi:hypothetical protein FDB44_14150 [Clostridium botulinum]|uniref:hypothetical protein n=1 Tax=Clostridium botulinum TaxID=1491 RepID=UPI000693FD09|nr:hypothetical protein [Clostridium botulinum]MBY6935293.1 hypothetical protein [Clostridium botulinum]NFL82075.1 hypothetical protein [Clostridium botulinum]NFN12664.1 hypothetical protein [Clostridium botulinum]NFO38220.1 hypothetical protein [Clostridium botulinum]NFO44231.1 hypothetical protein [Clostridium botulinum]
MSIIGLFGSELTIKDGFSKAFSSFTGQADNAKNSVNSITGSISKAELQSATVTGNMKTHVMGLAAEYKRAGLTQSEAMKKAWSEVESNSKNTSDKTSSNWGNSFNKIKNDGNNAFKGITNSVNNFSNSTLGTLSKLTAGYLSFKGAVGLVNTSVKDASEFQNASVFLNAVYGEQQGKEKYKWATKEANDTPFEEGEVASGLARAKSLGLKDDSNTFKMYEDLGSYAKIQKVGDLNSAIDALSDAQNGEWMRLQTITGTKRAALEEYADAKGLGKFTNKKGQVTDKEKLMNVLKSYMDDKGISGMTDKFAKTADGRKSALKGNIKKSLAELAGIADNGTIKDGSLFDKFSKGMETMIASVNNFSKSESFDKIADGLGKLGNSLVGGLDYITEHPELPGIIAKLGGGIALLKVSSAIISPITKVSSTLGLLGNTAKSSSLMLGKAALGVGLFAATANSFFSKNGKLHNLVNDGWNYGAKDGEKTDVADTTKAIFKSSWNALQYGGAKLLGKENAKQEFDARSNKIITDWQESDNQINNVYNNFNDDKGSKWDTIPSMISNGSVTKNNTKNTVQNKFDVSLNVDTIRETADVNELMDAAFKILDKYTNTRNNLDY